LKEDEVKVAGAKKGKSIGRWTEEPNCVVAKCPGKKVPGKRRNKLTAEKRLFLPAGRGAV